MKEIEKLKARLKAMPVEEVDRALFELRVWCLYELDGYADYRDTQPEDNRNLGPERMAERRRAEREAEILEAAIPKAVER